MSNSVFSKLPLSDNLEYVRKLGFKNIEFNMQTVEQCNEKSVYKIRKILEKNDLKCLTLHSATFPVTDEIEIPKAIYFVKVSAHFASILSAPIMVVHSNVSRKLTETTRNEFLSIIYNEIQFYAKKLNVRLSLENLSNPSKSFGNGSDEIDQILKIIDNGSIGLTLDFCHGETTGQTMKILEKYQSRISNIHISNKNHGVLEPTTPNLRKFLMKLQDFGYSGPLTIELNSSCNPDQILKTKSTLENIITFAD
ncbi:MAG: sugar phosphate isomerase/epimerase [Candidatus Bathyarchaeota archaeon]